jgi:hypothetical protein
LYYPESIAWTVEVEIDPDGEDHNEYEDLSDIERGSMFAETDLEDTTDEGGGRYGSLRHRSATTLGKRR